MLLADSGINDQLVKRALIDQTCFEFIDVSYFGLERYTFSCRTLQMLYSAK